MSMYSFLYQQEASVILTDLELLESIHSLELIRFKAGFYKKQIHKFWLCVDKSNECWNWKRKPTSNGYGQIAMFGRRFWAHRVSYMLHFGQIPEHLFVLHKCDNRKCCNPSHLFLGTIKDNYDDMVKKGRDKKGNQRGSKNGNATLNEEIVSKIKLKINSGQSLISISREMNINYSTIRSIKQNRNWSYVC